MNPIISIIVPVYNGDKYLSRCVDSILNQTFQDWELLLVDDGSTDKSGEICDEYVTKDDRIRGLHKSNGGVSSARNYGLTRIQGEWVTFIDGDDYIEPNYFSILLSNVNVDLIVSGVKFSNTEGKSLPPCDKIIKISEENKYFLDKEFCGLYFRTPWAKLFKRDIIERFHLSFNTNLHIGEDTEFVFRYISIVKDIRLIPFSGYCYKLNFYEQARRHAMNAIDLYHHLDSILWTSGLKPLCDRLHYNFPLVSGQLKIYYRRLYFLYLTNDIKVYPDFKREIKNFKRLKLRYYAQSLWKEAFITFILKYLPFIAYYILSRM